MAEFQAHQQLILRLPDALAEAVRGEMALDGEMEAIEVKPQGTHEDKGIEEDTCILPECMRIYNCHVIKLIYVMHGDPSPR
jgi:hypothetical protein